VLYSETAKKDRRY